MPVPLEFTRRLSLGVLPLCAYACGSDFEPPIAATNVQSLTFACDPDDLPGAVGEFQILTFANALGSVDPASVEVRLTFVPDLSDLLAFTPASGSLIPLGAQTVTVEVLDCSFESAEVTFIVDVLGRDIETGALITRSFTGTIPITNENVVPTDPGPPAPAVARQLAEAMTMRDFEVWPPVRDAVGDESSGAAVIDIDRESLHWAFDQDVGLLPIGDGPVARIHGMVGDRLPEAGRFLLVWVAVGSESFVVDIDGGTLRGAIELSPTLGLAADLTGGRDSWLRLADREGAQVLLVPVDRDAGAESIDILWDVGPTGPICSIRLR